VIVLGLGKRIAGSLAVLLAVSAAVFFAGNALAPGSAVTMLIGAEGATSQQQQQLRHQLGLDRPLGVQYREWVSGVLRGDFGVSPISHRTASAVIAQETPVSFELAFLALFIATIAGIPVGALAAVWADRPFDYVIRGVTLTGLSVPVFVTGTLLALGASRYAPGLYAVSFVPLSKNIAANVVSLFFPAITAAIPTTALLMQMTRGTMLECLSQYYVVVADARGVPRLSLYFVHTLKNALPPILTFLGFQFGILLGSLFIVENVFSLPGLASGIVSSINNRDYVLLEAQVMVTAAVFVTANVVVELLEPIIDPRKRVV
jgi:peptide/nickel transport system permease protein